MKIKILDAEQKHSPFITSYVADYLSDGIIYDIESDKRSSLRSKMLYLLPSMIKKVAVNAADENEFIGFICYEDGIVPQIHFIYVKKIHQKNGIGLRLLQEACDENTEMVVVPCKTPNLHGFLKKLGIKPLVRFFEFLRK